MPKPRYLKLSEVPRFVLQITGGTISIGTVRRWCKTGRKNSFGVCYRLRTVKLGSSLRLHTTEGLVRKFFKDAQIC